LAVELGIAPEDRVYLEPEDILAFFYSDYSKFSKYLLDDLEETLGLIKIFLPSYLASSKNIPINIQDIVYAGATRKATALFMIDYYDAQKAIPKPQPKKQFEGAISKAQEHGIYYNVHKYDVSSLYPSIMMTFKYFPKLDTLGVFEKYLRKFTADRLHFKKLLKKEEEKIERGEGSVKLKEEYDSYQLFAKIFINSFYGILGNEFFAFNDYDMAAAVTAKGREILMNMLEIIEQAGGVILSLDTDGIYYSAPDGLDPKALLDKINVAMSKGIVVEFEKSFKAMFSYKGKTYAALTNDGKLIVKGSAFKGRGKPSFIRKFLRSALMDFLTQNFDSYREKLFLIKHAIADRTLNVEEMIESKTISYDYNKYISRTAGGKMGHFEAMEREEKTDSYKAGDKVYYYYAGDTYTKKTKSDMVKLYDKENVIPYNSDYYIEMVKNWEDAFEPFIKEKDVI
jgi:DNA polymerase elongation subunit (family B)